MSDLISLRDYFSIVAPAEVRSLSKSERVQLMDSALNTEGKRGLEIQFLLSSSDRVTNHRIYTADAQRAGMHTWTEPFGKPILRNHDSNEDPMGRITGVQWVANDQGASGFFRDLRDFVTFKDQLASRDPQGIYDALNRNGLLENPHWPGTGFLRATALITDEQAIEKFTDGRYLTFSAGAVTDALVCGLDGADWGAGEICEHRPGKRTEDGELPVFITGSYAGKEASVVNKPANDLSQLQRMALTDSMVEAGVDPSCYELQMRDLTETTWALSDALSLSGDDMNADSKEASGNPLADMDPRTIAMDLFAGRETAGLEDALKGDSTLEVQWLVRIHDALHREYDWVLRHGEDSSEIPTDVFKFHGALHGLSDEKSFRDAFVNGPLDERDSKGAESTEYVLKGRETKDAEEAAEEVVADEESLEDKITRLIAAALAAPAEEADEVTDEVEATEAAEDTTEEVADESTEDADESVADGDEQEAEEAQEEEVLEDGEAAPAVHEILDAVAGGSMTKEAALQAFDAALSAIEVKEAPEAVEISAEAHQKLADDYKAALKLVQDLKAQLSDAEKTEEVLDTSEAAQENENDTEALTMQDRVENPSEDGGGSASKTSDLGDFERQIVERYAALLEDQGEVMANRYLHNQRRRGYLPRGFQIERYLQQH